MQYGQTLGRSCVLGYQECPQRKHFNVGNNKLACIAKIVYLSVINVNLSLVISDKLGLLRLHTWLKASFALVAHTALINDTLGEVSVYLVPAMESVAM